MNGQQWTSVASPLRFTLKWALIASRVCTCRGGVPGFLRPLNAGKQSFQPRPEEGAIDSQSGKPISTDDGGWASVDWLVAEYGLLFSLLARAAWLQLRLGGGNANSQLQTAATAAAAAAGSSGGRDGSGNSSGSDRRQAGCCGLLVGLTLFWCLCPMWGLLDISAPNMFSNLRQQVGHHPVLLHPPAAARRLPVNTPSVLTAPAAASC